MTIFVVFLQYNSILYYLNIKCVSHGPRTVLDQAFFKSLGLGHPLHGILQIPIEAKQLVKQAAIVLGAEKHLSIHLRDISSQLAQQRFPVTHSPLLQLLPESQSQLVVHLPGPNLFLDSSQLEL